MKPLSPFRTNNKGLATALAAMLTAGALAVMAGSASGEEGEEDAIVGALVQFVEAAPKDHVDSRNAPKPAPVVDAKHLQQLPPRSNRVIYRITSESASVGVDPQRESGRVRVRISSKEFAEGSADVDLAAKPARPPHTVQISDRANKFDEESQQVGYQATLRVHVKEPKSDPPDSFVAPAVENMVPGEDVADGEVAERDVRQEGALNDYRLASEAHSLVLLVEPNVLDVLERDPEKTEKAAASTRERSAGNVMAASNSLIVLAQPPQEGDLESIASMSVDRKVLAEHGLRPIGQVGADIRPEVGELPTDYAAPLFARVGEIHQTMGATRDWGMVAMNWEAKGLCYGPLRFEEVNLERYGYSLGPVQPAISAAHFFGTLPMLPYKMAATSRWNCQYSLGHYRPGNYVPFRYNRTPLRLSAGAVQAAAMAGAILVFP